VRIHAADALNEHGRGDLVIRVFAPETGNTTPQYRIGVWRVMARAAGGENRAESYVARNSPSHARRRWFRPLHAVEHLAKLGVADPPIRPPLSQWLSTADERHRTLHLHGN